MTIKTISTLGVILLSAVAMASGGATESHAQGLRSQGNTGNRGTFRRPPWPADIPISGIDKITAKVYSFRYRGHRTMFVVTSEGVIMTDPINPRAAPLLMKEVRKVTDKPIKYMIYSHEHRDHESGGKIFKDAGATVISQEKCAGPLKKNPRAVAPDETFKDRRDITLGDTTIELYHFGKSHGNCLAIMRLPKQRLAYTVDILTPHSVVFRNIRGDLLGMIKTLKAIQNMDVDRIVPGHGLKTPSAPLSVAGDALQYLADLRSETEMAMAKNPDPEAVKKLVDLKKYEKWRNADRFLMQNVEGMMRIIKEGK